jgi:hypothetical protein
MTSLPNFIKYLPVGSEVDNGDRQTHRQVLHFSFRKEVGQFFYVLWQERYYSYLLRDGISAVVCTLIGIV